MSKVAVVCGASGGLGAVLAHHLHMQGYRVFATQRQPDPNGAADWVSEAMDITDDASVDACVRRIHEQAGRIDVVVNCCNEMTLGSVAETDMAEVAAMFDVNVIGAMRVCRAFLPIMQAQGEGLLINMSSLGGVLAVPYLSAYTATKFALEAFSEALYHEVRDEGIDVVIMQPVAMAMPRAATGSHLKLAAAMTPDSAAHGMARRMALDTEDSPLTPAQVAIAIQRVIEMPGRSLRVPLDRARAMGLVKRLAPQFVIDRLIKGVLVSPAGQAQPAPD